jgi:chloride channel protein, CIC family
MLEVQDTDPDRGGRLGRFIRNLEYLYKWLLLGIIIGVVAGLGAVIFYLALRYTSSFLLGYVAGYHMPTPLVEGGRPGSSHYQRPWALPLVTTAGALVSASPATLIACFSVMPRIVNCVMAYPLEVFGVLAHGPGSNTR